MTLDIRLPIGQMFVVFGALLVGYGAISDTAIYARSFGVNVNLWWGAMLLVFGGGMLYFGRRAGRRGRDAR